MSGRMRTGQVTMGPSREAAYGMALSQEVKIADRPVTQQVLTGGIQCTLYGTACAHKYV